MDIRKWLHRHSLRLLAIRDTPSAIAGGVAIGIFLGFTPLFGLKTLLSIVVAWLFRCNLLAAVIAVTLHDLLLPFVPLILRVEYQIGYWLLSDPHQFPPSLRQSNLSLQALFSWTTFFTVGGPLLLGSAIIGLPFGALAFILTRGVIVEYRKKHPHHHHHDDLSEEDS